MADPAVIGIAADATLRAEPGRVVATLPNGAEAVFTFAVARAWASALALLADRAEQLQRDAAEATEVSVTRLRVGRRSGGEE